MVGISSTPTVEVGGRDLAGEEAKQVAGDSGFEWRGRTGPFTLELGAGVFTPTHTSLALAETIEVLPGEAVADVGCGCGVLALVAARLGAGLVVGTDIVPAAVHIAALNARRLGLESRAEFRVGHLLDPLSAASVDVVIGDVSGMPDALAAVTGWLPGGGPSGAELPVAMLEGAERVLRPGGRLYLPTASIHDEAQVLSAAARVFGAVDLLATRQFPLPGRVARSDELADLLDRGIGQVEQRGSRLLWRLRLWSCRRPGR